MKIGVLGTGVMGATLGRYFRGNGHTVMFGSRTPGKAEGLAALGQLSAWPPLRQSFSGSKR